MMRRRLLCAGFALVGFAVTLAVTAWPHRGSAARQPPPPRAPIQAWAEASRVTLPAPVSHVQQAAADDTDNDAEAKAPLPPLPDPSALPSYEEDQAARNADALRSARSR